MKEHEHDEPEIDTLDESEEELEDEDEAYENKVERESDPIRFANIDQQ